jgi:hypothetical protein
MPRKLETGERGIHTGLGKSLLTWLKTPPTSIHLAHMSVRGAVVLGNFSTLETI